LTRLSTFIDRISTPGWDGSSSGLSGDIPLISMQVHEADAADSDIVLHCSNLTVLTPDAKRSIIGASLPGQDQGGDASSRDSERGIDFTLRRGDRVLVVGTSGTGKSSLVRAISGLWQVGTGTVNWHLPKAGTASGVEEENQALKEVFFCPQKPYNPLGSLREQVMYPNIRTVPASEVEDAYLLELLRKVRLQDLAYTVGAAAQRTELSAGMKDSAGRHEIERAGLRAVRDWGKQLSLGEQQRLAFARVLFNRPTVVVLDGTSLLFP
jgi:ABC-type uncharacterized transport system fused permease/ATPase subunit